MPMLFSVNRTGRPSLLMTQNVDEEEEIFIGPVGLREQFAAKKVDRIENKHKPLSPLSADQQVELFLEAQKLAVEIKSKKDVGADSPKNSPKLSKPPVLLDATPVQKQVKKTKGQLLLGWESPVNSPTPSPALIETTLEPESMKKEVPKTRGLRQPATSNVSIVISNLQE